MRSLAFIAPLAVALTMTGSALAQPSSVAVSISPDFAKDAAKLGERDVQDQVADLTKSIEREMARTNTLDGAQIALVITDLKPNRPTFQQLTDRPGLDAMRSLSIGGASVEGTVTTASGERLPVKFDYYSPTIQHSVGAGTWSDAQRAFDRLARNLANGRYVSR